MAWPEPCQSLARALVMAWSWPDHGLGLARPGQEPGPRTLGSQGSRPMDPWDADFLALRPGAPREHPGTTKDQFGGSWGLHRIFPESMMKRLSRNAKSMKKLTFRMFPTKLGPFHETVFDEARHIRLM